MSLVYKIDVSTEFGPIENTEAYSADEVGETIAEVLTEQNEGTFTIEVEAFDEGGGSD